MVAMGEEGWREGGMGFARLRYDSSSTGVYRFDQGCRRRNGPDFSKG